MILVVGIALKLFNSLFIVVLEPAVRPFPPGLAEIIVLDGLICGYVACPFILFEELVDFLEQSLVGASESFSQKLVAAAP